MKGRAGSYTPEIILRTAARTDRGLTRPRNEDACAVADLSRGTPRHAPIATTHSLGPAGALFVVADGMGGAEGGDVASRMAVDLIFAEVHRRWVVGGDRQPGTFALALRNAVERANARIHAHATTVLDGCRMGTTATVAGILGDVLYVAQIGDSRAYLMRAGTIRQITKDQSYVQELVESGQLTRDEAATSEHRHIILQALGPEPRVTVDLTCQRLRRGDAIVLCTDGLSGIVTDDVIAEEVLGRPDPDAACRQLIVRANALGGPDNITVIVCRLDGAGLGTAVEEDRVGHEPFATPGGEGSPARSLISSFFAPRPETEVLANRRSRPHLLASAIVVLILLALLYTAWT